MKPNPALEKLGFAPTDRVVIFHADDIGMCQSTLTAYEETAAFGLLSAASTMVPCPWFPAAADFCHHHPQPKTLDMGIHLTLTSEWTAYRWGPLSTRQPAAGLMDDAGYFPHTAAQVHAQADPAAVAQELQTQIERALAAGIDVTHIDSHMFAIFHPTLLPLYFQLARHYRLPAFMIREAARLVVDGDDPDAATTIAATIQQAEADGIPLLDEVYVMPLHSLPDRLTHAQEVLHNLKPGITYFIIHPAHDTPELRALAPDWQARVEDYELFINDAWRDSVAASGVHVIGYRALRDLMRSEG